MRGIVRIYIKPSGNKKIQRLWDTREKVLLNIVDTRF